MKPRKTERGAKLSIHPFDERAAPFALHPPRLFVYGTLKTTFDNRWAQMLRRSGSFVGPARVRGRLYQVGHHTGMKRWAHGNSWVLGELFRLHNPRKILQALDHYEGEEFCRVRTMAYVENVGGLACWTYEYSAQPSGGTILG